MKNTLLSLIFISLNAHADFLINRNLMNPRLDSLACPTYSGLNVYLMNDRAIFNKGRANQKWPEIKGASGEFVVVGSNIHYFTPGKPQFFVKDGQIQITFSMLNDGMIIRKQFAQIPSRKEGLTFRQLTSNLNCIGF